MIWRVELTNRARRDLRALDNVIATRVIAALERLAQTGDGNARSLQARMESCAYASAAGEFALSIIIKTIPYKCSEFRHAAKLTGFNLPSLYPPQSTA